MLIDYFSSILQVHLLDWTVILEILSHSWRGEKPSLFLLQLFWILDWIGASRKYYGYITDIMTLCWDEGRSMTRVLPVLKRWRHLRRFRIQHLSHLLIVPNCNHSNHGQLEILRDKLNEFILPQRPNFKLVISKYWKFENEFRRIFCCTSTE